MPVDLPELLLADAPAWRAWLEENHHVHPGVFLVMHKKGGAVTALTQKAALDEALCFGWIDGLIRRRDEGSYLTRFTPRAARSSWSLANVANIERLQEQGLMRPAGLAAVEAAKADGRWELAYAGQATAELPPDLAAAIAVVPAAAQMLEVLTSQNRYALIFRLSQLRPGAARDRRIEQFVQMLARHEAPYPQRRQPTRP